MALFPPTSRGNIGRIKFSDFNAASDAFAEMERKIAVLESQLAQQGKRRDPNGPWDAEITAVSAATNATYDAACIRWPYYAVETATPINREHDTADVTYTAAAVGDTCLIHRATDGSLELEVYETIDVSDCETAPAIGNQFMAWLYFR